MLVKTTSKINLFLSVINKRLDNYHNILSLFLETDLGDHMIIEKAKPDTGISIYSKTKELENKENIICRVWDKLHEVSKINGHDDISVSVDLTKNVPMGSGLGGGSSDGTFFINAIDELYKLGLTKDQQLKICYETGSDMGFFIDGGLQKIGGVGDEISSVSKRFQYDPEKGFDILIATPNIHVSTKEAYELLNMRCVDGLFVDSSSKEKASQDKISVEKLVKAIEQNDFQNMSKYIKNDFEELVFKKHPELSKIKEIMIKEDAFCSMMTGSGSAIFGLFKNSDSLRNTQDKLQSISIQSVKAKPITHLQEYDFLTSI